MNSKKDKLLVGITGANDSDWKKKILECEKLRIKRIALFLECYTSRQRKEIYSTLLDSNIKEISFVHAKNDMELYEFEFLRKNFKTKYFNIHTNGFEYLDKWKGIHNKLLLELGFGFKNKNIPTNFDFNKIAGFCIDIAHFRASKERGTKEYFFVMQHKKQKSKFIANHLNGYSKKAKTDLHTVKSKKELDYLKEIPKFIFGKYIALEMTNSIKQQLQFRDYIYELIKNKI